jgi:hypothetical protein
MEAEHSPPIPISEREARREELRHQREEKWKMQDRGEYLVEPHLKPYLARGHGPHPKKEHYNPELSPRAGEYTYNSVYMHSFHASK